MLARSKALYTVGSAVKHALRASMSYVAWKVAMIQSLASHRLALNAYLFILHYASKHEGVAADPGNLMLAYEHNLGAAVAHSRPATPGDESMINRVQHAPVTSK